MVRGSGEPQARTGALAGEITRFVRLLKSMAAVHGGSEHSALLLLLLPLMHEGPMRLRELAHAKGADPSTVSRQAAQLVAAGLVRSEPDPADRRARRLALTASGRRACRRMVDARCRAIDTALAGWSDAKVAQFTALFEEFNQCVAGALATPTDLPAAEALPHQRRVPALP